MRKRKKEKEKEREWDKMEQTCACPQLAFKCNLVKGTFFSSRYHQIPSDLFFPPLKKGKTQDMIVFKAVIVLRDLRDFFEALLQVLRRLKRTYAGVVQSAYDQLNFWRMQRDKLAATDLGGLRDKLPRFRRNNILFLIPRCTSLNWFWSIVGIFGNLCGRS